MIKKLISLTLCLTFALSIVFSASAKAYNPNKDFENLDLVFSNGKPDIGFYINAAEKYILESYKELKFGTSAGEWSAMNLLRGMYTGYDYINQIPNGYFDTYINNFEQEVINKKGNLHSAKSTEYSRLILALSSLGYDIKNVAPHYRTGGYNGEVTEENTENAKLYSYDFILKFSASNSYLYKQGLNGPVWALLALNTGDYNLYTKEQLEKGLSGEDTTLKSKFEALNINSIEEEKRTINQNTGLISSIGGVSTKGKLIEYILAKQATVTSGEYKGFKGGWALSGAPDPDMTGMALQALAPFYLDEQKFNNEMSKAYYDENIKPVYNYNDLKQAVENAVFIMSKMQRDNGGFASWGSVNSESIAQIIVALTELKIDPLAETINLPTIEKECSFIKDGAENDGVTTNNMIDCLLSFFADGSGSTKDIGGFRHVTSGYDGGSASGAGVNGMATDQALYALIAYDRFAKNKNSLYNMTDMTDGSYKNAKASTKTLTLNMDFISENQTIVFSPYETIKLPTADNTDEFIFDCWTNQNGEKINSEVLLSTADSDITLTAKWIMQSEANDKVNSVIEKINSIGKISFESEQTIKDARAAYDELSVNLKKQVNNINVLLSAEKEFIENVHRIIIVPGYKATCTKTGLTDAKHCTICDKDIESAKVIKKLPHKAKWITVKKPTYFKTGKKVYKCVNCGQTLKAVKISKLVLKVKISSGKNSFKVKCNKIKGATGFQIKYKIGGKTYIKTFKTKKALTKTITKLQKGRKCKVSVRAISTTKNQKKYGSWSKTKLIKIK